MQLIKTLDKCISIRIRYNKKKRSDNNLTNFQQIIYFIIRIFLYLLSNWLQRLESIRRCNVTVYQSIREITFVSTFINSNLLVLCPLAFSATSHQISKKTTRFFDCFWRWDEDLWENSFNRTDRYLTARMFLAPKPFHFVK